MIEANREDPGSARSGETNRDSGPDDDPLVGRTLSGRYRLIEPLGRGGMSSVYLGRHVLIERLNAIKVLHESLSSDPSYRDRFLREARAVNRINHPNIVEISDYGELTLTLEGGRRREIVFLVMEYIPGETLERIISRGPLAPARVLSVALQLAGALSRAHQTGVIHRDLKPDNVLLVTRRDGGDLAKLTDFGVAKVSSSARAIAGDQVFGTPGYIAPEYLLGETAIDGRADLYSLGVLMYEALTGRLPFDGEDESELLVRPLSEDPIPARMRNPEVPEVLDDLCMRLLQRRPDDRFRDAFALLEALASAGQALGIRVDTRADSIAPGDFASYLPHIQPTLSALSGQVLPAIERAPRDSVNLREHGEFTGGELAGEPHNVSAVSQPRPSFPRPASVRSDNLGYRSTPEEAKPPKFSVTTPAKLLREWRTYFELLESRLAGSGADRARLDATVERRQALELRLEDVTTHAINSQRAIDLLDTRGRDFRGTLGRAIDHLARDLSTEHGKLLELRMRRSELHMLRRGTQDMGVADALLWEEAAVDDDMREAKRTAEDLGQQLAALQDSLFTRNVEHESEVGRATGILEGEMAAIARLHRDLEALSLEVTRQLVPATA